MKYGIESTMKRIEPQAKGLGTYSIGRRESFLKAGCDWIIVMFWEGKHGWEQIDTGGNCGN